MPTSANIFAFLSVTIVELPDAPIKKSIFILMQQIFPLTNPAQPSLQIVESLVNT